MNQIESSGTLARSAGLLLCWLATHREIPPMTPADELLRQRAFLCRLARCLIADTAEAEDAVQDTLVLALERGPRQVGSASLGAWLARVLRRRVMHGRRGEQRRRRRERAVAREEAIEVVVSGELAAGRELLAAVEALDESFRTVITLRYLHQQDVAMVARELGLPPATVRTRTRRGLAKLRERLERDPRGSSTLAALPLLASGGGGRLTLTTSISAAASMTMTSKVIASAAAVGLALLATWGWTQSTSGPLEGPALGTRRVEEVVMASAPEARPRGRVAVAPAEIGDQSASSLTDSPQPGSGRVLDLGGRPMPDVPVANNGVVVATTDAEGRFVLGGIEGARWQVAGERYAGVVDALEGAPAPEQELLLIATPSVSYAGHVREQDGTSVKGARVMYWMGQNWSARLDINLDHTLWDPPQTRTDDDGGFRLEGLPRVPGATLSATAPDRERWDRIDAPTASHAAIAFLLPPPRLPSEPMSGVVLDPDGRPVPFAHLTFGQEGPARRADGDGRFVFDRARFPSESALRIVAPGWLATDVRPPTGGWPAQITIPLRGRAGTLAGRVVDAQGRPCAQVQLMAEGFTALGILASGSLVSVERESRQPERELAFTAADGVFRLTGLQDHAYTLVALRESDLVRVRIEGLHPDGEPLEVRMPALAPTALTGVLITADGSPAAGVTVSAGVRGAVRDIGFGPTSSIWFGDEVVADQEGRFSIPRMPVELELLRVRGPQVLPAEFELASRPRPLTIRVQLRCHLRIELGPRWSAATRILAEGADGLPLAFHHFEGDFTGSQPALYLTDGLTGVCVLPPTATALLVMNGEVELYRAPLHLIPGEVTVVRID